MTQPYDDYDDNSTDQGDTQQGRNPLREQLDRLEKQNKALQKQVEEASKATRALEFVKAGVDVNTPMGRYFVNGYDGDLTTDAIKAAAEEAGLLQAKPQPAEDAIPATEQDALRQMQQVSADAVPDGTRNWDAEIESAKSEQEVIDLHKARHGATSVQYD